MKVRSIGLAAVATVMVGLSLGQGAEAAAPGPARVSADTMGVRSTLSYPWRVELLKDGSKVGVFGPGTSSVPYRPSTLEVAVSSEAAVPQGPLTSAPVGPVTSASWYCQLSTPPSPTLSGSQLASYAGVSCYNGRPGDIRLEWWFDRSSWSGWRQYTSGHSYTSWTSAQAQGTNIYAQCGSGGTYDYRSRVKANLRNTGSTGGDLDIASGSNRYGCGTG